LLQFQSFNDDSACFVQIGTPDEAALFVKELQRDCLALILDGNGNHVIQRCLQKFDAVHTQVRAA
jgi:hypothetical protein